MSFDVTSCHNMSFYVSFDFSDHLSIQQEGGVREGGSLLWPLATAFLSGRRNIVKILTGS
jgi:hypothetical protein